MSFDYQRIGNAISVEGFDGKVTALCIVPDKNWRLKDRCTEFVTVHLVSERGEKAVYTFERQFELKDPNTFVVEKVGETETHQLNRKLEIIA
jgi:hypothetical protein